MQVDVLLVDDEKHILTALTRVMRQAGISVTSFTAAEDAMAWLKCNQAALILSDYQMPGMNGTEFLAKVEAKWPDTVRIILSGHSDFDTVLKAVHTGVVHKFLAKPWSNQELIEHVKTSLVSQQSYQPPVPEKKLSALSPNAETDASEVQLQVVLNTMVDGIVTINQKGIILSTNLAVERIFAYSSSELIGENVSKLMPEPYRSQHDHYLSQYQSPGLKGILGNQRRLVGLRKNGEVFPIELSVNSMQIAGENLFLGMIRDISRRVSAERQNQLLLDALEIAQDGVALFGAGDRLVHCNHQFRKLYCDAGVELEVGQTYKEFFQDCLKHGLFPEARENPDAWLQGQIKTHNELPITKEYELKTGQWIEIHETRADNGSVIVSHLDITKQKQTQICLQQAVADAEHAKSARGRFLAMMSHEIRTPLNGVFGLLQLLDDTTLSNEQADYVEHALSCSRGLMTVISDILDFSKIDAEKLELFPVPYQLSGLVDELEKLFQLRVEEKSILLNINLDPAVPDWVLLDGQRLRQVLLNLLGNAIKFTDYGKVELSISVKKQKLFFKIEDNGIGIPENEQNKIFSEFTTITNATDKRLYEGTGLGLSISHKLVTLMEGNIEFASRSGVGSSFWFDLPLLTSKAVVHDSAKNQSEFRGCLLVVDDSPTNRMVAKSMLESFGLDVVCADNGQQAILIYNSQAKSKAFDLILMDISMPGMSGLETFEKIQQSPYWQNTPVLAFTAYAQEEDQQKFTEAGMQGHLVKPLEKTVLAQTITPYLNKHGVNVSDKFLTKQPDSRMLAPLLDGNKLDQLASDTSEEALPELAAVFINDANSRLAQLNDPDIDISSAERHFHTLASSASLYGLMKLADQARKLENIFRTGEEVRIELNDFTRLTEESLQELQAHLKQRIKK